MFLLYYLAKEVESGPIPLLQFLYVNIVRRNMGAPDAVVVGTDQCNQILLLAYPHVRE